MRRKTRIASHVNREMADLELDRLDRVGRVDLKGPCCTRGVDENLSTATVRIMWVCIIDANFKSMQPR